MSSSSKVLSFNHEQLGALTGLLRGDDVVQFRGIPYAHIPARFRQSTLTASLLQTPFDATKPGPICPQPDVFYPAWWEGPLSIDGVQLDLPGQDEYNCLNLSLTVPREAVYSPPPDGLPVLFFVHGGGLSSGSSSLQASGREVFDAYNLVKASMELKRELIVVAINYRLGPLGFLASSQLAAFNQQHGEPVGNYGLHDQRRALDWVAQFVKGFGGNPENITIYGNSAGGVSCHLQSTFPQPKFKRTICASGAMPTIMAQNLGPHNEYFQMFCEGLDVDPDEEDVLGALQAIPVSSFVRSAAKPMYNPVVDGEWIQSNAMEKVIKDIQNAPDMMFGSATDESELLDAVYKSSLSSEEIISATARLQTSCTLLRNVQQSFPYSYPDVIATYGLETALIQPSNAPDDWAELMTDVMLRAGAVESAIIYKKYHPQANVVLYDCQVKNPFRGFMPCYDKANHGVNDLVVFNVAEDLVPKEHAADWRDAVVQMQAAWIDFCYGRLAGSMNSDVDAVDVGTVGPVLQFANKPAHGIKENLEASVGAKTIERWNALLSVCRNEEI